MNKQDVVWVCYNHCRSVHFVWGSQGTHAFCKHWMTVNSIKHNTDCMENIVGHRAGGRDTQLLARLLLFRFISGVICLLCNPIADSWAPGQPVEESSITLKHTYIDSRNIYSIHTQAACSQMWHMHLITQTNAHTSWY